MLSGFLYLFIVSGLLPPTSGQDRRTGQDMQQSGTPSPSCPGSYPSASDYLPLSSLSAAPCGSENAPRPQKDPHSCVSFC